MDNFGELIEGWSEPELPLRCPMQGKFVRLEPLDEHDHATELFEAFRLAGSVWDYLPYGPFTTLESYCEWLHSMSGLLDPFFFAVRDLASGKALGVMSYLRVNPSAGPIEVGHINWSPELQKTACATEAIFLMMAWAFEAGYRRFEWKCNAMNAGSRRAAERFGFSYEGVFRQAGISKGRNRDTAWFACIDAEWSELRTAYEIWLSSDNFDSNGLQKESLSDLTRAIRVANDPSLAR